MSHPNRPEAVAPSRVEGQARRVAEDLRERITAGRLPPGTRMAEERLVADLGVSRNTLREAFRLLAHDGLLVHRFNSGVFVPDVTESDVADVYRARRLIEPPVLRSLTPGDAVRLGPLGDALAAAAEAAADGRWTDVGTANMRFHQELVGLARSPRLDEITRRLLAELRLVFAAVDEPRVLHEPFVERNRRLYDAIAAGRFVEAADDLVEYLATSERSMRAAFAGKVG